MMLTFDPQAATNSLQEAVRIHDRDRLDALVSDRMLFSTGRWAGALGKREWIDGACAINWRSFRVIGHRAIDLGEVFIVEHRIEQEIGGETDVPVGGSSGPALGWSRWLATDVWAREPDGWRLVNRHPELLMDGD